MGKSVCGHKAVRRQFDRYGLLVANNVHAAWFLSVLQAVLKQGGLQFCKADFYGMCFHGLHHTCKKVLHKHLFYGTLNASSTKLEST